MVNQDHIYSKNSKNKLGKLLNLAGSHGFTFHITLINIFPKTLFMQFFNWKYDIELPLNPQSFNCCTNIARVESVS